MAQLAIKAHPIRTKEVIEILEMLGGKNRYHFKGDEDEWFVLNGNIQRSDRLFAEKGFTLEEFFEKYPYKVGDKVNYVKYNDGYSSVYTIQGMRWTGVTIEYLLDSSGFSALTKDLQPYKEETMKEKGILVAIDLTKELKVADEVEVILGDYEFVLKDGKTYFVKKKPKYPETYEECCEVLGYEPDEDVVSCYRGKLIESFVKLLICRNAYWKLAGDWKPYWSIYDHKFCIGTDKDKVIEECVTTGNRILAFPTEEMRDAFYENFKELIELVKELL